MRERNNQWWEKESLFRDSPMKRFMREKLTDRQAMIIDELTRHQIDPIAMRIAVERHVTDYGETLVRDLMFVFLRPESGIRAKNALMCLCVLANERGPYRNQVERFCEDNKMEFTSLHRKSRQAVERFGQLGVVDSSGVHVAFGEVIENHFQLEAMLAAVLADRRDITLAKKRLVWQVMYQEYVWEYLGQKIHAGARLLPLLEKMGLDSYRHGAWGQVFYDLGRWGFFKTWRGENPDSQSELGHANGSMLYGVEVMDMSQVVEIPVQGDWVDFCLSHWVQFVIEAEQSDKFLVQVRERTSELETDSEIVISVGCVSMGRGSGDKYEIIVTPALDEGLVAARTVVELDNRGNITNLSDLPVSQIYHLLISYRLAGLLARLRYERQFSGSQVQRINTSRFGQICKQIETFGKAIDSLG